LEALSAVGPTAVFVLRQESVGGPTLLHADEVRTSSVAGLTDPPRDAKVMLRWLRHPQGHPSDEWFCEAAATELRQMVVDLSPDVVVVDGLWLHRYIPLLRENSCSVVLNAHNAEAALAAEMARQASSGRGSAKLTEELHKRVEAIERRVLTSVHQVWACSEVDARAFTSYGDVAPVFVVPNTVDVASYTCTATGRRACALMYAGSFEYPPNVVAARLLVEDVFPELSARCPAATLMLVGRYPPEWMMACSATDNRVQVTGAVPDARPYFAAASVMAVPLVEGGGTRFKVLEAFASGLPVISTEKGVQGLEVEAGHHYLPAESAEQFVDCAATLFDDEQLRGRLAGHGRELVARRYDRGIAISAVATALVSMW
jgi:glycosyltransferase involved in cell wall biosynthesis